MDILRAAQLLRPGTAWNLCGGTLVQAMDGTPRVTVPTEAEIQAVLMNAPKEKSFEERFLELEAKVLKFESK